jgi:hypothetical protein
LLEKNQKLKHQPMQMHLVQELKQQLHRQRLLVLVLVQPLQRLLVLVLVQPLQRLLVLVQPLQQLLS